MNRSQIPKLYVSNFLIGLVFWYGIEKLFMISIGIDAVGIGIALALFSVFTLVFDIPAGILADKWSRKGVLVISSISLAIASFVMGSSHGLVMYLVGYMLFGAYVVTANGTYQAIIYDSLHEEGIENQYSKIRGRTFAMMLLGSTIANILSGFVAGAFGYNFNYLITVIPCILNVAVIMSIKEPKFHKKESRAKFFSEFSKSVRSIFSGRMLRGLILVMVVFLLAENFMNQFCQLYFIRYFSSVQIIGILSAAFAMSWGIGSVIAHRLHDKFKLLVAISVVVFTSMSFIDSKIGLVLFMIQTIITPVILNKIETTVQENIPSSVRASTLSSMSALGRLVIVPSGILIGWLVVNYNILWALRFIAALVILISVYWLISRRNNKASMTLVT